MNTYRIEERQNATGWNLAGDLLPYTLWYQKLDQAIEYAFWIGRFKGVHVQVFDKVGKLVQEERREQSRTGNQQPEGGISAPFDRPHGRLINPMILDPKKVTVIDDSEFRYPVETENYNMWIESNGPLMPENYESFCKAVPQATGGGVLLGLVEKRAESNELLEAGAPLVKVAYVAPGLRWHLAQEAKKRDRSRF